MSPEDKFLKKPSKAVMDAITEIESNTNHNYTREQVKKWKSLSIARPDWVSEADWIMCRDELSPIQGQVLHLAAMLMSADEIEKSMRINVGTVYNVINSQRGQEEIQRIQDKFWAGSFKDAFNRFVVPAMQTIVQTMSDPNVKAQTRVEAASKLLDRALGKPVQQIEVENSLLRSVFEKLDQENKPKEATLTAPTTTVTVEVDTKPEKPKDALDSWVEENL